MLGTIAAVFIWGLGIIAALNQMGIATTVTTPVLVTVLATIGGVVVVGMGGGLIVPMRQRWETWIGRMEAQLPEAKAHTQAYQRGMEDAGRSGARPVEQGQAGQREQAMPGGMSATGGSEGMPGQDPRPSAGGYR
jgi:hypothetical protein